MRATTTVGRVLFTLPFAVFGIMHFMHGAEMGALVRVPGGIFWVYLTGVALIAAAVGILFNILGEWAGFGLAVLLMLFVVAVHVPNLDNAQMRDLAMMSILKDTALAGAALTWAGLLHGGRAAARKRLRRPSAGASTRPAGVGAR